MSSFIIIYFFNAVSKVRSFNKQLRQLKQLHGMVCIPEFFVFLGFGHKVLLQLGLHGGELGLEFAALLSEHGGCLGLFFIANV